MSKKVMLKNIEKAQQQIENQRESIKEAKMRQKYHFMAETGWINDPNGLIYYKGKYHFFYQYNPYDAFWGSMHWGHAVSNDMLHWEYLPIALAPSEAYDDHSKGGCFSGSAIEHDGKLYLIYTGTIKLEDGFVQTQCVAYSEDGIRFEKYEGNPVVTVPKGIAPDSFRDPKVWKHEEYFYMVVGASRDKKGQALLFRSEDLLHWEYVNVMAESRGEWGEMWECPDFYQIGDKYVLTCSPIKAGEHTSIYMVGDFDYNTGKFEPYNIQEMDWGFEYYAPQSFETKDGRRITITWANQWEWMPLWKDWGPTYKEGWCGFFNIPREVYMLEDGMLQFPPIREIENLRFDPYVREQIIVNEQKQRLIAGNGVQFEMKFMINLEKTDAERLLIHFRSNGEEKVICEFDFKRAEITVDRNHADKWSIGSSRSPLYLKGKQILDVHVLSDQSSLEIFTDKYRNNHSNNIYAGNDQNQIIIQAYGGLAYIEAYKSYGIQGTIE